MSSPARPNAKLIEPYLSANRLGPYLREVGGDLEKALTLYEWNAQAGAAFLEVLGHLEVVLRNALAVQLTIWHSRRRLPDQWYHDPLGLLDAHREADVIAAQQRLQRDGKPETPGRIVAELPFGFWRFLLGRRYQNTLWTHALRHAFTGLRPARRSDVYDLVDRLSRLRNRIAHHEPVHQFDLAARYEDVLRMAELIDPNIREWIAGVSRVPTVLSQRP